MMVFIIAELLVGEVGCDVEEGEFFMELFGELLHNDYVKNEGLLFELSGSGCMICI